MNKKLYYVEYTIYDCSEWFHTNAKDYILADNEQAAKDYIESQSCMELGDYYVNYIREATYEEYNKYKKNHK